MKIVKNILFTLMLVLFASSVCAVASFNAAELDFGSDTQLRGQDTTAILHLTNDGTDSLSLSLTSSIASTYNVRFSQSTLTLAPNTSSDITVTLFVPVTQTSTRTQLTGGITVTATNAAGLSKVSNAYLTTMSMLSISKVTLEANGDGTEHSLREGETYDDADVIKPGVPITVTAYVKNLFTSSEDITIEDISVDIRSSGDLDLDDSNDMGDLDYGDKDSVSFTAEIPSDAEDGDDYDITVKVTGKDENGVSYSDTYKTTIEVQKTSHEILITDKTISPQVITCNSNNRVTLNVDLKNNGKYNENRVALTITNDALGISQRFYQISLDRDDTIRKTYSFVVPNTTLPGKYELLLTSYYSSDVDSNADVASIEVLPCTQNIVNNNNQSNNNNANNGNTNNVILPVVNTNGATPVYGTASFTDSTLYITLLIIAVVVMVIILIILLIKFVF